MADRRITDEILEKTADFINHLTRNPAVPCVRVITKGTLMWNVGNFHISYQCGGVCLHQVRGESGGVRDVFNCGHIPKRELKYRMDAYIEGIRDFGPMH